MDPEIVLGGIRTCSDTTCYNGIENDKDKEQHTDLRGSPNWLHPRAEGDQISLETELQITMTARVYITPNPIRIGPQDIGPINK